MSSARALDWPPSLCECVSGKCMSSRLGEVLCGALGVITLALSASNGEARPRELLPSQLVAHPEKYDGKRVVVRGYVVIGPESRNIFDSARGAQDRHGACLGLD